jgi:hypothetical protein
VPAPASIVSAPAPPKIDVVAHAGRDRVGPTLRVCFGLQLEHPCVFLEFHVTLIAQYNAEDMPRFEQRKRLLKRDLDKWRQTVPRPTHFSWF